MNEKIEGVRYFKITIELPLPLLEFLRDHGMDHREYAEDAVVQRVGGDLDALDVFGFKDVDEVKKAIEKYGLNEILKGTAVDSWC